MSTASRDALPDELAEPQMPLLWALRDLLGLTGTKFGCGVAACGACTVHVDGQAVRSCVTPLSAVAGKRVVTIEALGSAERPHPLQRAWVLHQVPQCGYCQSGMLMAAAASAGEEPRTRATPTSTPRSPTSAAAAPIRASAPRSRPRPPKCARAVPARALA